jgi:hypothetical protein
LLRDLKTTQQKQLEKLNQGSEPDDKLKEDIVGLARKIADSYKTVENTKVESKS